AAHEANVAGVGQNRPIRVDIIGLAILVHKARGNGYVVVHGPLGGQAQGDRVLEIGVASHDGGGIVGIHAVDPAAVTPVPDTAADSQDVVDNRFAGGNAGFVARRPPFRESDLAAGVQVRFVQARLGHDVAHGTTLGAGAEQGPLRAAQDFHPIQVKGLGQRVVGVKSELARLDGRVVDIDTGS